MLILEIIPFKTDKERIKIVKQINDKMPFTVQENCVCTYRDNEGPTFEIEGYNV